MKYKIGDVARILGVSTDLLRYYEKKGVVTPEKDETNDYRYYDSWDINFLLDCLWFKNFGFSIEQIADIVKIPSAENLGTLFSNKEDELRATIKRCQLLLLRSEQHREDLRKTEELLGKCEICDSPAFIRYINRIGNEYLTPQNQECMARKWLQVMPFNRRCFEMGSDAFLPGNEDEYRWGYSLAMDYVKALDFKLEHPCDLIPSRPSVHTVFKSTGGRGGFAPSLLQYALGYAEENGLRITAPIHGVLLASVMEKGKLFGYFEAWLPIG